jgi:hypothetical protein
MDMKVQEIVGVAEQRERDNRVGDRISLQQVDRERREEQNRRQQGPRSIQSIGGMQNPPVSLPMSRKYAPEADRDAIIQSKIESSQ